uniref:Uncharacterized protein n=2 Tax=Arundo donax TaxID=35708 RepID=A0A0A9E9X4_ARUDO
MPLYRRIPKLRGIAGGMHIGLPKYAPFNLKDIVRGGFKDGDEISLEHSHQVSGSTGSRNEIEGRGSTLQKNMGRRRVFWVDDPQYSGSMTLGRSVGSRVVYLKALGR